MLVYCLFCLCLLILFTMNLTETSAGGWYLGVLFKKIHIFSNIMGARKTLLSLFDQFLFEIATLLVSRLEIKCTSYTYCWCMSYTSCWCMSYTSADVCPTPPADVCPTPSADVCPTPPADVCPTPPADVCPTPPADVCPTPPADATTSALVSSLSHKIVLV